MQHWTDIRSSAELKAFRIAYKALPARESSVILAEMIKALDEFKLTDITAPEIQETMRIRATKPKRKRRTGFNG